MKLTKAAIEAAAPGRKDRFLWCAELPRFGVRIARSGRKTYIARYRNAEGLSRMVTLARVCDMPPSEARDLARKVFGSVASGDDPSAARTRLRHAARVCELYERYDREYAQAYKKPSTRKRDNDIWRLHIIPRLGSRAVVSLSTNDLQAMHAAMRHIPATANRALAVISHAWTMARRWGWVNTHINPTTDVVRYRENTRDRVLSRGELAAFLAELDKPEASDACRLLFQLLLLTGARLREIMASPVEWIDWERGLLILPDSKTGAKRIQLSASALALLESRRGERWIIEGIRPGTHLKRPYDTFRSVCKRAGISGLRIHDLRHTVGTLAHSAGLSQREIMQLLGHRQMATTARYLHVEAGRGAANVEKIAAIVGISA